MCARWGRLQIVEEDLEGLGHVVPFGLQRPSVFQEVSPCASMSLMCESRLLVQRTDLGHHRLYVVVHVLDLADQHAVSGARSSCARPCCSSFSVLTRSTRQVVTKRARRVRSPRMIDDRNERMSIGCERYQAGGHRPSVSVPRDRAA